MQLSYHIKIIIYIQIQPDASPPSIDIFISHIQNIEEDLRKSALYVQMTHLENMVEAFADPHTPTLF